MPVQKVTREEILQKAMLVFKRQGYHRTTMEDLAQACGLLKGSFYHYFRSKEVLMNEVLLYFNAVNEKQLFSIAYDEDKPPKQRLEHLLDALFNGIVRSEGGCLMGNTALETSLVTEAFTEPLRVHFNNALAALAHLYRTNHSPEKARELAEQATAEIQGSLVLVKVFGNEHVLTDCRNRAVERL
ncbi:TetR/AcrR family transcriptional regulator [Larkinella humicola]|uniref:TetR/AcrR family transcriptional regulator n=1 Tax=Larkinella humicola TaxID=2607654 RepID=A0A5N1JI73_9BACT|nr:TetR/AcrR family transcriptional regulator [Larkinella humicola]KAA9354862.1 TetR/AcrR family transcriptional regulator [Larkinella humicola]